MSKVTNEIIDDRQITLDEWLADYVSGLKDDVQTELNKAEQEQNSPKETHERLMRLNSALTRINKKPARKKAVKQVTDKLSDNSYESDTAYYHEAAQELMNVIYKTAEDSDDTQLVPGIRTCKPSELMIPNVKLAERFFNRDEELQKALLNKNNQTEINKPKKGRKLYQITGIQCMKLINEEKFLSGLNSFDRNVHNGICSIYKSCVDRGQTQNIIVTPGQIYAAFTGSETRNAETLKKVSESIQKMMMTVVKYDWSEHAEMAGLIKGKAAELPEKERRKYRITANLIYAEGIETTLNNGSTVEAFRLMEPPTLYKYAEKVRQLISVKASNLKIPAFSNTEDNVVIKNYLASRVELMKNPNNKVKSDRILFDTVFEECQIDFGSDEKKERKRKRETICKILNHWVETKYILGYELVKNNGKNTGVQILL